MTLSTYLLYLAAVTALVLSPGPTMLMSLTNAINHGAVSGLVSAAGSVSAVLGVMLLSSLGLGALLAASETAFLVFKAIGAAYLIYLGVKLWRSPVTAVDLPQTRSPTAPRSLRSFLSQGFMVGASNPKALLFFSALFPQFINAQAAWAPQFALLALSFMVMEFSVLGTGALFVARLAPWLRAEGRARGLNRMAGGLFGAMGCALLALRQRA